MQRLGGWKVRCNVTVLAFMTLGNFYSVVAATAPHSPGRSMNTAGFAKFIQDYAEAHHFKWLDQD
jgi:hypothetical protein